MIPKLSWRKVRQGLELPFMKEPVGDLISRLEPFRKRIKPGSSVAVAVGSRKISNIDNMVAALLSFLSSAGAKPFVVPAMGSHGGGRPEAQSAILEGLGISEGFIGFPIISKRDVVFSGLNPGGLDVWVDKAAWEADYIIPVNRVKAHTAFRGEVESGPSKLLAVGLGKQKSAETLHSSNLSESIPSVAKALLSTGRIPFGVAVVENGRGETARIEVLEQGSWLEAEAKLLRYSKTLMPRLPWSHIDLLVVERMGKDISGTGMDLNVIGMDRRFPELTSSTKVATLVVLDLTAASFGNATGIGYADFTTRALVEKVDWETTRLNCRVTGFPEAAARPKVEEDGDSAVKAALLSLGPGRIKDLKAVRIADTAHLEEFYVEESMLKDLPEGVFAEAGE